MIYSYDPIDIGFDPRAHGMAVDLPADATSVRYRERGTDALRVVNGPRAALVTALEAEGYKVLT